MSDIYLGLGLMVVTSWLLFHFMKAAATRWPTWLVNTTFVLTCAATLAYIQWLWNSPRLVEWLPFSAVIVIGNWFPIALALEAGLYSGYVLAGRNRRQGGRPQGVSPLRSFLVAGTLAVLGGLSLLLPLRGEEPICQRRWDGNVCLQTTPYTCSPASAATVLSAHGIPATEGEMASLCLTRDSGTRRGTAWQGLYRGLKLKTRESAWDVKVFRGDLESLRQAAKSPMLLTVALPSREGAGRDQSLERRESGWIPGQPHTIVLLRARDDGWFDIGDPSSGHEVWSADDMLRMWNGQALQLVRIRDE